ncbi:MBL fold metallo-hydrolase, partial [Bdellovibrionota bacterium FG-2]
MTSRIQFIHERKAQLDQELAIQKNRFLSATFRGVSAARKDAQFIRPEYILLLAGGFAAWRLLSKKRLDPAHAPVLGWTQETSLMNSLPSSLAGQSAQGLIENQPIAQFEIGDGHNLIYLIIDWQSREAAIVDPQSDLAPPLEALKKHGISLRQILLTHTHGDHTAGV